jgi:hypothetical protein
VSFWLSAISSSCAVRSTRAVTRPAMPDLISPPNFFHHPGRDSVFVPARFAHETIRRPARPIEVFLLAAASPPDLFPRRRTEPGSQFCCARFSLTPRGRGAQALISAAAHVSTVPLGFPICFFAGFDFISVCPFLSFLCMDCCR